VDRLNTPRPPPRTRRGLVFWTAALLVAALLLGVIVREILGSQRSDRDDRIWISDGHKDFHGPALTPKR